MSFQELLDMTESPSAAITNTQAIRDKIFEEFDAATNSDQRSSLLQLFKATMDIAEKHIAKSGDTKRLAEFREVRADDYGRLLIKESSVGDDVSPEMFMGVTYREVAAGRLTQDDPIRQMAFVIAARKASFQELIKMLRDGTFSSMSAVTMAIRYKIFDEFDAATNSDQRSSLLQLFKAAMDNAEEHIAEFGDAKRLTEFREERAECYGRLLVKESSVGDNLSPEMMMAVTNREIEAGRLRPDDSIRQFAVQQAAAPAERWLSLHETEAAEARKASDRSIESLKNELTTTAINIPNAIEKIRKEFRAAVTSHQRGMLLAFFEIVNDHGEEQLAAHPEKAQLLEDVRKARAQLYRTFIVEECTVGLDTPVVRGDISVDMLMHVTNREITAGRMTEDHSLRKLAVEGAAAVHMSHAELVAKHAKLRAEAAHANPSVAKAATESSNTAHGVGAVLGRKLKGLFRK